MEIKWLFEHNNKLENSCFHGYTNQEKKINKIQGSLGGQ